MYYRLEAAGIAAAEPTLVEHILMHLDSVAVGKSMLSGCNRYIQVQRKRTDFEEGFS